MFFDYKTLCIYIQESIFSELYKNLDLINQQIICQFNQTQIMSSFRPHQQILKDEKKNAIVLSLINQQIQKQRYLNNAYAHEIATLKHRKQQLQMGIKNREQMFRCGYDLQSSWHNWRTDANKSYNMSLLGQSRLDESQYFNIKGKTQQSPVKKLNSPTKIKQSIIGSPQRYNKAEDLRNQIKLLESKVIISEPQHPNSQSKITDKDKLALKEKEDGISHGLLSKIAEQQKKIMQQIQRQAKLELNLRLSHQISKKIQKIREQTFKNQKILKNVEKDLMNSNKDIIKAGYTSKMIELIKSYDGLRCT